MSKILESIGVLMAAYPHAEWPEPTQKLYIKMLSDLDPDLVMKAVEHFIATSTDKWPPQIGQIRATVAELVGMQNSLPSTEEAFAEIVEKIKKYGSYWRWDSPHYEDKYLEFSHPALGEAVKAMGGWENLCLSETFMVDRAHFRRIYDQIVARGMKEVATLPQIKALANQLSIGEQNGRIESKTGNTSE